MTLTATQRIDAYRSSHRIFLVSEQHADYGLIYRCAVDGLRVHPTRNGRWRHDSAEIKTLLDAEYGGPWGQPKENES